MNTQIKDLLDNEFEEITNTWQNRNALHVDVSWVTWNSKWKVDRILDSFMWVRDESQAWKEAREKWVKVFNPLSDIVWEDITDPEFVMISDKDEYLEKQLELLKDKIFSYVCEFWPDILTLKLSSFEKHLMWSLKITKEEISQYVEIYLRNRSRELLGNFVYSDYEIEDMVNIDRNILWYWFLKWYISLDAFPHTTLTEYDVLKLTDFAREKLDLISRYTSDIYMDLYFMF